MSWRHGFRPPDWSSDLLDDLFCVSAAQWGIPRPYAFSMVQSLSAAASSLLDSWRLRITPPMIGLWYNITVTCFGGIRSYLWSANEGERDGQTFAHHLVGPGFWMVSYITPLDSRESHARHEITVLLFDGDSAAKQHSQAERPDEVTSNTSQQFNNLREHQRRPTS